MEGQMEGRRASRAEDVRGFAVLLLGAAAVLMICSMNSWLYPVNPWSDVNILGTMGRGMLEGQVPYRDLFDHKGPLIYFLFGLCMKALPGTYHGLYLLEVLCCAGALFFGWKTLRLYLPGVSPLWLVPLFALFAASDAFSTGASAEELLLLPAAWSLYDLLAAWRAGRQPSVGALVRGGVLAGCVLWTKFNLLSFHFVWMAAVALDVCLRERALVRAVKMCLAFLGGMALATLPWLIYFGVNGALGNLFGDYLAANIFNYATGGDTSLAYNLARSLSMYLRENPAYAALLAVGAASVLALPRARMAVREKAVMAGMAALMVLSMYSRAYYIAYYSAYLAIFLPFALLPLYWVRAARDAALHRRAAADALRMAGLPEAGAKVLGPKLVGTRGRAFPRRALAALAAAVSLAGSLGAAYILCDTTKDIGTPYAETPQAQLAAAIRDSGVEEPTLLQYMCTDVGVYYASGAAPADRWFTAVNIVQDQYIAAVDRCVAARVPDFLMMHPVNFEDRLDLPGYEIALRLTSDYARPEGDMAYYGLYRRVDGAADE